MVAYDSRRPLDPSMRLSEPTLAALAVAFEQQRGAGFEPVQSLEESIVAAAREARDRQIPPEALLVQLKHIADQSGPSAMLGDGRSSAIREWIVRACVKAYFATDPS
jgi:hypothetical protein